MQRIFVAERVHSFSADPEADANAVATADGRVRAVGGIDELRRRYPQAQVVDFGAAAITPGLTDAHIHITEWALARREIQLGDAGSISGCLELIRQRAQPNEWVTGRGWNPHRWGGAYPDRRQLDAVTSGSPAAFQSHDMHALWVNSRALELAGIDAQTADPPGGRIVRDEQGQPSGMLLETAAQLVVAQIPRGTEAQLSAAVIDAQRELHSYGITGIHSFPGVHLPEPDPFVVLQDLFDQDTLELRVLQHIAVEKLDDAIRVGLRSGAGHDWMRIGGVKLFLDGALGSRTAWMREPYEGSADVGVQVLPEAEFQEIVTRAANAGLAATVHAIGDAAVALAFDVLTAAPRVPALPHRIEHVQCFPMERMTLLNNGVICSVQPSHLMTDWPAADRHWGERAALTYAFRTLLDGGAVLACGSDAPVEPADPRRGLYAAVARRDERHQPHSGWHTEQCIMIREVMAGYTTGAALAAGAAGLQGELTPGAYADLAVWKQDPLTMPAEELLELGIAATVVNGDVVWEA